MPIQTRHLSGGYTNQQILTEINLTIANGEWLSLVGANGSGKSTLLKLISRLLHPQQGTVLLDGKAIHSQPAAEVARKLAFLPQQQIIPQGLTVRQLVSLGRTPHQPWWQWELNTEDQQQVAIVLQLTQLEKLSDRPVEQLSGGERQRAFLALALAQKPKILLLDEPTTYLDIHYQLELLELLKKLNQQQNLTILTVLHDVNLAARYSSRIAFLRQGKLFTIGAIEDVLTPDVLAEVLDIRVSILETPVGLQICPLAPLS
jgi:iron complex transport system ATP-binding protein